MHTIGSSGEARCCRQSASRQNDSSSQKLLSALPSNFVLHFLFFIIFFMALIPINQEIDHFFIYLIPIKKKRLFNKNKYIY